MLQSMGVTKSWARLRLNNNSFLVFDKDKHNVSLSQGDICPCASIAARVQVPVCLTGRTQMTPTCALPIITYRTHYVSLLLIKMRISVPSFSLFGLYLSLCACSINQSYPTHCNPMDCSPPGFSVLEILQARILEWVAISSSRRSSQPRDRT